jgi:hypothetical protein
VGVGDDDEETPTVADVVGEGVGVGDKERRPAPTNHVCTNQQCAHQPTMCAPLKQQHRYSRSELAQEQKLEHARLTQKLLWCSMSAYMPVNGGEYNEPTHSKAEQVAIRSDHNGSTHADDG